MAEIDAVPGIARPVGIPLGVSASIVYLFVLLGALLERAGAGSWF